MTIEVGRSPLLAEGRILRPLAVFGLLHGTHEWMEIFILELQWVNVEIPLYWGWIRLALLAISFVSLIAYGVQVLRPPERLAAMDAWVGSGFLALYAAIVILIGTVFWQDVSEWISRSDILARYVLAMPGAILAGLALFSQAKQANQKNRYALFLSLRWAAFGFLFYGVTQMFVSQGDFFPANLINSTIFLDFTGAPVQLVRALMALIITVSLIRASQIVEDERQAEFVAVKDERLEALERIQDEMVKRENLRRELLRYTVIAQEEERSRISRALHDELAQTLTGFSLDLATLKARCTDDERITSTVSRLQGLSREMSQGLFRLVHDLRPAQLDDLGLIPALKQLIDDMSRRANLDVAFDISGKCSRMDPLVETVFFRVTQEALTNIIRYAQTKKVEIQLDFRPRQAELVVRDFGVGFEVDVLENPQDSMGIAGMQERVRSVDGEFKLVSAPGEGTCIKITLPCIPEQNVLGGEE